MPTKFTEKPDSNNVFNDTDFDNNNGDLADDWVSIKTLYPNGVNEPLLPDTFSREQFGQGDHYECFMLSTLATLVRYPDVIRNCFVTKKVRRDGRYTFQFFRDKEWVKVEIDDKIAMVEGVILYCQSPTKHWWPLLLEKAYAKFYTAYDHLEGCTLQETYHDLTGHPVLNIPMDVRLARAANCEVTEGAYWLEIARKIDCGEYVASALTKGAEVENCGVQPEQQYGILEIFSLTGSSQVEDIVIHLHNPFEDETYTGPLNPNDSAWTPKLIAKHDVENPRSIFLPLVSFLKMVNSMQLCFLAPVIVEDATYFDDQWKGETAGGNPTSVTWRKNPLYYVSNLGHEAVTLSFVIKQKDQRHLYGPEVEPTYKQCGMILTQFTYPRPIPTKFVTGNNHKTIHKSLFLNSREVSNSVVIPPNSLCYLVPSCMHKGAEADFTLAVYRFARDDYSNITLKKLDLSEMNWEHPIAEKLLLQMRTKDRVDFFVDGETDVHILLHQLKPFISPKTGGDAMAQDFMGMYLYNDMDRKINGVHAATNYRETSIIHHLPASGRYALSITCPRGSGDVPAEITIVTSKKVKARRVETPADAAALPDEDENVEDADGNQKHANRIDYDPINLPASRVTEVPDSNTPFEDKRFMIDNKAITNDPWVHIGDLYPEGKTKPLLPDVLSRDQFAQGEHYECCCLSAFATLVGNHPDIIRNVFVSKKPRKDGRYTFQFHRYGQWLKVEIDDRIPMSGDKTYFCNSPTHHWWPLLLEKAYAKFYTLYQNLEGCTLQEIYHDFTGCAVISIPLKLNLAKSAKYNIDEPNFWLQLNESLANTSIAGLSQTGKCESLGLNEDQGYGVLDFVAMKPHPTSVSDVLVRLHNPFVDSNYTGPMSSKDQRWTSELRARCEADRRDVVCMPVNTFCDVFLNMQQAHFKGLVEPSWHFNSEWGEGTNGGNPTLVTWRENPLYVVRNPAQQPVEIIAMIRQPDQRHLLHTLPDHEPVYIQCGLVLSQSMSNKDIPTYLITGNNHQMVHKGLFLNAREVANNVVIPADSLCYLVPSAMHHEMGMFMLSYWYKEEEAARTAKFKRLRVDVARRLPAVAHVTLQPKGKDRVDFMVDCPTDAHILLAQLNQSSTSATTDAMTDDFLGMYLYDDHDDRVAGVIAATNFRETGLVAHLPKAGRYALSVTCPQASGPVACRAEVVCLEKAHVRITDAPEDAAELPDYDELQRGDVPFDNDRFIAGTGNAVPTPRPRTPETPEMTQEALAAQSFLKPEYKGIPVRDLPLSQNADFIQSAKERQKLIADPVKNASRIQKLELDMHKMADQMADEMHEKERVFLDPEPEGVPLDLLPLNDDPAFSTMEDKLRLLNKDAAKNRAAVKDLEGRLNDRAHELARQLKEDERLLFLDPMPLGIPYQELDLDNDPEFHEKEIQRLRLRQAHPEDEAKIEQLNRALNKRAEELAKRKLSNDRDAYLAPEHLHVANEELPLDDNKDFVYTEAERQDLLKDRRKNGNAIRNIEQTLNNMATEMAKELLAEQRPGYLADQHHGRNIDELPLNDDDAFLRKEKERRGLLKAARPDTEKVRDIENLLNAEADKKGKALNKNDRGDFMKPSYLGIPRENLPLDEDEIVEKLETKRAQLKHEPARNRAAITDTEKAINNRAMELARQRVLNDRSYLDSCPEGVPLDLLPLDTDPEFQRMEKERLDILAMSNPDARALANVEKKLNERAHELARQYKEALRAQYTENLPVDASDISLYSDAPFIDMEQKMYDLIAEDPIANRAQIEDIQEALRKRAMELANQRKTNERAFLDQNPLGIPLDEIGLDDDAKFLDLEKQLRAAKARGASADVIAALQRQMQDRAYELAAEELARRAPLIDANPAGMPLSQVRGLENDAEFVQALRDMEDLKAVQPSLQRTRAMALQQKLNERAREIAQQQRDNELAFLDHNPEGIDINALGLDTNPEFLALQEQRRHLIDEDPVRNASKIKDLENQMNELAHKLAREKKLGDRESVLGKELNGIPISQLPFDNDAEYAAMEREWHDLMKDPVKNAKKIADLENKMRDRAQQLADAQKLADREAVLGMDVDGIPVDELRLDDDAEYVAMEREWHDLMKDPVKNAKKIADLEKKMRERAKEVAAAQKLADREALLGKDVDGIPIEDLHLDDDAEYVAMEQEWRDLMKDPVKNAKKIADLEKKMRDRAKELADAQKLADREAVLGKDVDGVPIEDLHLDDDAEYAAMEQEWRDLMKDPVKNARKIADLEKKMRARAKELADAQKLADGEAVLGKDVDGIPIEDLHLEEDPEYSAMRREWQELMKDPVKNAKKIADLENKMRERAQQLADAQKLADREAVLGKNVDGIPVDELRLDDDTEYVAMEREWRDLMKDPVKNARKIADLEKKMRERAKEVAAAQKLADREAVLGKDVSGIPVSDLRLDDDAEYVAMEQEWRDLMKDPVKNAKKIADLEKKMRERAKELADAQKLADREAVLGKDVSGIPVSDLRLDDDAEYVAMEQEWRDLMKDPVRNARKIADLEKKMRQRAKEIADAQKLEDREAVLGKDVDGVPIEYLHLDEDPEYVAMEREWRDLMKDPVKNAKEIADLEKKMRARAKELAKGVHAEDLETFMKPEYAGYPLSELGLDEDPVFQALQGERLALLRADPKGNAARIKELEDKMNERAEELANAKRRAERESFLGKNPGGVPLDDLDLDNNEEFLALERERQNLLKDPVKNARKIAQLESKMRDLAEKLAKDQQKKDRDLILEPLPAGIKHGDLDLDNDSEYAALEKERARLIGEDPRGNAHKIADIEKKMNERAKALAEAKKLKDREAVLGTDVDGIPVDQLHLDEDPEYVAMEREWHDLMRDPVKNAKKIADLEKKMRDRAKDVADAQKLEDREAVLGKDVDGIPIEDLHLDDDAEYVAMEQEWRDLMKDPVKNARKIADLEKKMRERAKEVAAAQKLADREAVLGKDVSGIPVSDLRLDDDAEYVAMEQEWRDLMKDPVKNARKIADLEKKMRARAKELADAQKLADGEAVLGKDVDGIPIEDLHLEEDPEYSAMRREWQELMKDPVKNAKKIADLENKMRERAQQLADAQKLADREAVLGKNVDGIPVDELRLDDDTEYVAMEREWRDLMKDPVKNARKIADLEKKMRERAKEVAAAQKLADREAVLGKDVSGIPVSDLRLDDDAEYVAMEQEWRDLMKDPVRNAKKIADLEKKMRQRAKEIADAQKLEDREAVLGKDVDGIPIEDLHLDEDPEYVAMEREWRELMKDPVKNAKEIADLEKRMRERAKELAYAQKLADREAVLGKDVDGIPIEKLNLDEDPEYVAMEREWRELMKDPVKNARKIAELEKKMRNRAQQLADAQKGTDREAVLGRDINGILVDDVHLEEDPEYAALEREWRELMKDPVKNAKKIADLENKMRERAKELADAQKLADRESILGKDVNGIPISELPLDDDAVFAPMERDWHELMKDPVKNAKKIDDLEDRMRERAKELADAKRLADREAVLGKDVDGIPITELPLDDDAEFGALEREWRQLMKDPVKNAKRIADLEKKMRERAKELAHAQKLADREAVLGKDVDGIPISEIPLDEDPEYASLEREWRKLMKDPVKNAKKIADLEKKMRERAKELADAQKLADREAVLGKDVNGIPLSELPLDEDPEYAALEREWRDLMKDPVKNAKKIADLEKKMRERAKQLADAQKLADREAVLGKDVDGIPVSELGLDENAEFLALEDERRKLMKDPVKNAKKIAEVERKMRNLAHDLAEQRKMEDLNGVVPDTVYRVPRSELELRQDRPFKLMHDEYSGSKRNPAADKDRVRDLEEQLLRRAKELAQAKRVKDMPFLDKTPEGVPIESIPIFEDTQFDRLDGKREDLLRNPQKNKKELADVEGEMNDRAHELAKLEKMKGRDFLAPITSVGVPTADVPFNTDRVFLDLEKERNRLIAEDPIGNAARIAELEDMMNDRVDELARKMKWADRDFMPDQLEGIPKEEIPVDNDPEFLKLEEERAALMNDPRRNAKKIQELEDAMNDRARELAKAMKWNDRAFLDPQPEGVPLSRLGLDQDPEFMRLERLRKALIDEDPEKNAHRIANLEDAMNERAHALARELKAKERQFLDQTPEGVPLSLLGLDSDPKFKQYEDELRRLREDPNADPREIADLEEQMNNYVHELAKKKKAEDRARFLDANPEGVPLDQLPLDDDDVFRKLEDERYRLIAEDPVKNAARIASLEKQMNKRAHELAKQLLANDQAASRGVGATPSVTAADEAAQRAEAGREALAAARAALAKEEGAAARAALAEELKNILRPTSYGMPLDLIPVGEDPEAMGLLKKYRREAANPRKADEAEKTRQKLQDRVDQLAYNMIYGDRDAYLDPHPEGLNALDLPVHNDPEFREVALQRALLKTEDPTANADTIKDLEGELNDRAHELAGKWNQRLSYLDPEPEGITAMDVPLDDDEEFLNIEDQLNNLLGNPEQNAEAIENLKDILKERDHELANGVKAYDLSYLKPEYNGIPTENLDLHGQEDFRELANKHRRARREGRRPGFDADEILKEMEQIAEDVAARGPGGNYPFLDAFPEGVPLEDLDLRGDAKFRELEDEYNNLVNNPKTRNDPRVKELEDMMNARAHHLAQEKKQQDGLAALDKDYLGVPTKDLDLLNDPEMADLLEQYGRAVHDPSTTPAQLQALKDAMDRRANELAADYIARERASYLPQNPRGVPLEDLNLDNDPVFKEMERKLRNLMKKDPNSDAVKDLKYKMNEYVDKRARDLLRNERYKYLDPAPGGVPLDQLHDILDNDPLFRDMEAERWRLLKDPRNAARVRELEKRLNERAAELARQLTGGRPEGDGGFQDPQFVAENKGVADQWRSIKDIYPEGRNKPLVPENPQAFDVVSAPGDLTYLGPFLAALSREPPLLQRLFGSRSHPVGDNPYTFVFFDPNSNPVYIDVDDNIPCDANGYPKYTHSPTGEWWPLLVEKAYAKFVGGYPRFDDCTSHETLRDLTGRPVTHLPLDAKLSKEVCDCDFRDVRFWQNIKNELNRGDVYMAVSNEVVPDGIHPRCYYAVFDVIETVPGSSDPADVIVRIHNCFPNDPQYDGPLRRGDPNWTNRLRDICGVDLDRQPEFLLLPQPVFLRNFSSMQHCHINCGDRLTVSGEWTDANAGGNPKYTTFRANPIYLLENKGNRPAKVIAELRHSAPVFYDANNVGIYHPSSLAVLSADPSVKLVAPLLAYNTHKFVQKGLLSDARETSMEVVLPAGSTCYVVPYTKKKGCLGKFQVSVYPQEQPVGFTTLRPIEDTHDCVVADVTVQPGSGEGSRVDFSLSERCDVHVIVHQNKVTDPSAAKRGDYLAEDELMMAAYEDNSMLVASTGDASNAREHGLAFQANSAGRYTLLIGCPSKAVTGESPCTVLIYTPKHVETKLLPLPSGTKNAVAPRKGGKPSNSANNRRGGPAQPQRPASASNGKAPSNYSRNRGYSQ